MSEEQTPPAELAVPKLTPELIAELEAHGGKALVKRWQRVIRAMEELKANPIGPNRSAAQWLAGLRALIEALSGLRERDAQEQQHLDKVLDSLRQLEVFTDPQKLLEYLFEHVVERLQDADVPLDADGVEKTRAIFEKMSEAERQGVLYLRRLILTDDAFGIVVRGHVLIENALEECVASYVPDPVDLFGELKMFFAQKLLLAKMLGVISADEYNILKAFNKLRNEVAHNSKRSNTAGFHLTAERERELWNAFVSNPAMTGKWPAYDVAKHPIYLRYMVVHLYLMLTKRGSDLKERRLAPVVADIRASDPHAALAWVLSPILVHIFIKMPDFQL